MQKNDVPRGHKSGHIPPPPPPRLLESESDIRSNQIGPRKKLHYPLTWSRGDTGGGRSRGALTIYAGSRQKPRWCIDRYILGIHCQKKKKISPKKLSEIQVEVQDVRDVGHASLHLFIYSGDDKTRISNTIQKHPVQYGCHSWSLDSWGLIAPSGAAVGSKEKWKWVGDTK